MRRLITIASLLLILVGTAGCGTMGDGARPDQGMNDGGGGGGSY